MNQKKLLIDTIPFQIIPSSLNQNLSDSSGRVRLKGIIQRADAKNHNGRIYPRYILQRQMQRLAPSIKRRSLTGQLDHPQSFTISLQKICMVLTQYQWSGNQLYGIIQLTSNGPGQAVKKLVLKDNITVGISSRGMGSTITTQQGQIVQDDFQLITFDIVSQPSTIGAWMQPMSQNKKLTTQSKKKYNSKINSLIDDIIVNI